MPRSRYPSQTPEGTSPAVEVATPPPAPAPKRVTFPPAASPDPAEADALTRAQAGDHQAFAQLYSLHKRRIYSLCLRMVGNIAEAEDLTQEAFLQLHRKIATF